MPFSTSSLGLFRKLKAAASWFRSPSAFVLALALVLSPTALRAGDEPAGESPAAAIPDMVELFDIQSQFLLLFEQMTPPPLPAGAMFIPIYPWTFDLEVEPMLVPVNQLFAGEFYAQLPEEPGWSIEWGTVAVDGPASIEWEGDPSPGWYGNGESRRFHSLNGGFSGAGTWTVTAQVTYKKAGQADILATAIYKYMASSVDLQVEGVSAKDENDNDVYFLPIGNAAGPRAKITLSWLPGGELPSIYHPVLEKPGGQSCDLDENFNPVLVDGIRLWDASVLGSLHPWAPFSINLYDPLGPALCQGLYHPGASEYYLDVDTVSSQTLKWGIIFGAGYFQLPYNNGETCIMPERYAPMGGGYKEVHFRSDCLDLVIDNMADERDAEAPNEMNPGAKVPLNSGFDKEFLDAAGNPVEDWQVPLDDEGPVRADLDPEMRPLDLKWWKNRSVPLSGQIRFDGAGVSCLDENGTAVPGNVLVWRYTGQDANNQAIPLWEPVLLGAGEYVDIPENVPEGVQPFYVEGLSFGETDVQATFVPNNTPGMVLLADTARVSVFGIDLDVDSDNSGAIDGTDAEDRVEDIKGKYGKVVFLASGDSDHDGIPDFADGFDLEPAVEEDAPGLASDKLKDDFSTHTMTQVTIEIPESVAPDMSMASLTLSYDASDPLEVRVKRDEFGNKYYWLPKPGPTLRLWRTKKDEEGHPLGLGLAVRNKKSVLLDNEGDYVPPGEYGPEALSRLGLSNENRKVTLWIEGVRPSSEIGAQRIVATVVADPDGDGPEPEHTYWDAVRTTVAGVDLDMDSGNGDDDDDGVSLECSPLEESLEEASDVPGALVPISDGDADADGFADPGDIKSPHWMAMAIVKPHEGIDFEKATLSFHYSSDVPTGIANAPRGAMRIWLRKGTRTIDDLVRPGIPYKLTGNTRSRFVVFVEGVRPLAAGDLDKITVELDPDGPLGPIGSCSDSVKVRLLFRKAPVRTAAPEAGLGWVDASEGGGTSSQLGIGAGVVSGSPAARGLVDAAGLLFRVKCGTADGYDGAIGESWCELHKEMPSPEIFRPRSMRLVHPRNMVLEVSAKHHVATLCLPDNDRIRFHFNTTSGAEEARARDHHRLYMLRLEREASGEAYRLRSPAGAYVRFARTAEDRGRTFQVVETVTATGRHIVSLPPSVSASALPSWPGDVPRGFDISCGNTSIVWRVEKPTANPNDYSLVWISRLNLLAPEVPFERYVCEYRPVDKSWKITTGTPLAGNEFSPADRRECVETCVKLGGGDETGGGFTIDPLPQEDPEHPTVRILALPTLQEQQDSDVFGVMETEAARTINEGRKLVKTLHFLPGYDHYVDNEVLGEGSAQQANSHEYASFTTDILDGVPLERELPASVQGPGGHSVAIVHDEVGRIVRETTPMSDGNNLVVELDYASLDPADQPRSNDNRPRTETRSLGGVVVGRKWHVYSSPDGVAEYRELTETAASQGAAFGSPSNLRDEVWRHGSLAGTDLAGLPVRTLSSSGIVTEYEYSINNGSVTCVATPRRLATPGGTAFLAQVPGRAQRSISSFDRYGKKTSERIQRLAQPPAAHPGDPLPAPAWSDVESTSYFYDAENRLTESRNGANGIWNRAHYGLYEADYRIDESGSMGSYVFNAHHEAVSRTFGAGRWIYVRNEFGDLFQEWRGTSRPVEGNSVLMQIKETNYDAIGRPVSIKYPGGAFLYCSYQDSGLTTVATSKSDGSSETVTLNPDGSKHSIQGDIAIDSAGRTTVNPDGTITHTSQEGSAGTPPNTAANASLPCVRETCDFLGRRCKLEIPDSSGAARVEEIFYDGFGRPIRITCHAGSATLPSLLLQYADEDEPWRAGIDVDGDGELGAQDRIVEYQKACDGTWVETAVLVYAESGPVVAGIRRNRVSGFAQSVASESEEVDSHGLVTHRTTLMPGNGSVTENVVSPLGTSSSCMQDGLLLSKTDPSGLVTSYEYDAYGRRIRATDSSGRSFTIAYNDRNQVASVTDSDGHTTSYAYDSLSGELSCVTDPMGGTTRYKYDYQNRILRVWGTATTPVELHFDPLQRVVSSTTFRVQRGLDSATWPAWLGGGDTTQWLYDGGTGVLRKRTNAAGGDVEYHYGPFGRVAWRMLENGRRADYGYTATGELASVDYDDQATPDLAFAYDRLGRLASASDGQGTRTFAYDGLDRLASETLPGLPGLSIDRTYGTLGRQTSLAVSGNGYLANFGYDGLGRLSNVSRPVLDNGTPATDLFSIAYHQDTGLVSQVQGPHGVLVQDSYQGVHDLLAIHENRIAGQRLARFQCQYDALQRRIGTAVFLGDGENPPEAKNTLYAYTPASEMTREIALTTLPAAAFRGIEFGYDAVGNRTGATPGVQQADGQVEFPASGLQAYGFNTLNQLSSLPGPDAVAYDLNGNAVDMPAGNGLRWLLQWDGENRLVRAERTDGKVVTCAYDYLGRRVRKQVFENNALAKDLRFVYDGFQLIQELEGYDETVNGDTVRSWRTLRSYLWRDDLLASLRLHRPAGLGGDLELYAFHDVNRNLVSLAEADGTTAASYEYSAFGELLSAAGTHALDNPFRFSNEYWDDDLGLVCYAFRCYSPALGRWLSQDPIGEAGGINLYAMVGNNPVNLTDALGLMSAEDGKKMAQAVAGKSYLYLAIDGKLETYPQSRYADFCDLAAASGKAFANAAFNSLPFGSDYTLMEPTLLDAMNGYHTAYAISRIGSEFAIGYITGYYGTLAFAGKAGFVVRVFRMAMFAMDGSQNLSNVYQGARALSRDPTDMGAWLQLAGGSAGLAGNIFGMYRGLSEIDGILTSRAVLTAEKNLAARVGNASNNLTYPQFRKINAGRFTKSDLKVAWKQYKDGQPGNYLTRQPSSFERFFFDNRNFDAIRASRGGSKGQTFEHFLIRQKYFDNNAPSIMRGLGNSGWNSGLLIDRGLNSSLGNNTLKRWFFRGIVVGVPAFGGYWLGDNLGSYIFEEE